MGLLIDCNKKYVKVFAKVSGAKHHENT